MLDLQILQNKRTFIKTNGDTVVDLTRRSISYTGSIINQGQRYMVEDGIQMRGDLIANIFYQTTSFLCLLLKYNSISNPFSIDIMDILTIPLGTTLSSLLITPTDINGSNDNWQTSTRKKKKTSQITPKTRQDKNRLDYLQQNSSTMVAPPNISKDTSVKVVNGKIIFGTDVTSVKKDDCPDPISRTKLQAALIKNKISG